MLEVEYGGGRPVRIQGPVTGRDYVFSGVSRVQLVDPRDAVAILGDRHFRLKAVTRQSQGDDSKETEWADRLQD